MSPVSGVPLVGPQEELRGPSGFKVYSQGFFEPRSAGKVRIFEFYNNKKTKKQTNKQSHWCSAAPEVVMPKVD